ncbi:MAG: hypothetical protein K8953_12920, partial [Proteobacteria bacterium]|nr:hypothetical protein [Pseudomonadota bacterium]
EDNAMGVFISGSALEERGLLTGGRGSDGFAGGFVARRFVVDNSNPNVSYADWAQWFNHRARADIPTSEKPTVIRKSQFLTTFEGIKTDGTTAPTAITMATLNEVYYKPVTIPGDVNDGFSYFTAGGYSYAGILESTDLGALVEEVVGTAIWHGQLNFTNATGDFVHEFAINIDYETGKIDGFLPDVLSAINIRNNPSTVDMTDFALDGEFNEYGMITGTTNFAQYTDNLAAEAVIGTEQAGILSGIIGQGGAVGVFHGLAQNTYVGGFVVHPQVADKADVNYSDWIRGGEYNTIPTRDSEFLRTTDGEINTALLNPRQGAVISEVIELNLNNARFGLKNTVTRQNNVVTYTTTTSSGSETTTTVSYSSNIFERLEIGLDEKDGLAYFSSGNTSFAGILDTTNLGKPLVEVTGTTATWLGQLGFMGRGDSSLHDFALTITFTDTGGTIEGSVADVTFADSTNDFFIKGDFNSQGVINPPKNPQGVAISRLGTTYFGSESSPTNTGFLTGLIGQEGAVGAFVSTTNTINNNDGLGEFPYAGGFVATPPNN